MIEITYNYHPIFKTNYTGLFLIPYKHTIIMLMSLKTPKNTLFERITCFIYNLIINIMLKNTLIFNILKNGGNYLLEHPIFNIFVYTNF